MSSINRSFVLLILFVVPLLVLSFVKLPLFEDDILAQRGDIEHLLLYGYRGYVTHCVLSSELALFIFIVVWLDQVIRCMCVLAVDKKDLLFTDSIEI